MKSASPPEIPRSKGVANRPHAGALLTRLRLVRLPELSRLPDREGRLAEVTDLPVAAVDQVHFWYNYLMQATTRDTQPLARRIVEDPTSPSGKRVQFIPQEIAKAEISTFDRSRNLDGQLIAVYDGRQNFIVPLDMISGEEPVPVDGLPER